MIQKLFKDIFNDEPLVVRASIPIRLLGEYNACNDGHVLTTGTNNWVRVAVSKRTDAAIHLFSAELLERIELSPAGLYGFNTQTAKVAWVKPATAVLNQLHASGYAIAGMNILIDLKYVETGVPINGSIEAALYIALNEVFSLGLTKSGLMQTGRPAFDPDFYTCLFGKRGCALKIDPRKQTHDTIPLRFSGYSLLLFILGNSPATLVEQLRANMEACEAVIEQIKATGTASRAVHEPLTIRDISLPLLYSQVKEAETRRKAAFLIRENTRVLAATTNMLAGNSSAFGQKIYESDDGLVHEYETGSREANWLIDELDWKEHVAGARRLTGAWRNAVYALVLSSRIEEITLNVTRAYERHWEKKLIALPVATANGAEIQKENEQQGSGEQNRFV